MEFLSALVAPFLQFLGVVFVVLSGIWGAKRYNIGPTQDKLVVTLNSLVSAQNEKIKQLELTQNDLMKENAAIKQELADLTDVTVAQAVKIAAQAKLISSLETQIEALGQVPRTRKSIVQ